MAKNLETRIRNLELRKCQIQTVEVVTVEQRHKMLRRLRSLAENEPERFDRLENTRTGQILRRAFERSGIGS